MYNFIRIQYRMGRLTADQVKAYAPRWISETDADRIVKGVD